ncbi:MAG: hypothetical protein IK093_00040, partial [Ruminiclostridium sp.]|nr:hypothetical protein [Ruminiclostridium sp.]
MTNSRNLTKKIIAGILAVITTMSALTVAASADNTNEDTAIVQTETTENTGEEAPEDKSCIEAPEGENGEEAPE